MTLQHQETREPDTSEVIRLAQQMYECDRAENERRTSLAAAAEEMGIPSEYLAKAAAQLKARQVHRPTLVPAQAIRQRSIAMLLIAFGLAFGLFALFFFSVRAVGPTIVTPTVIDIQAPTPVEPQVLTPVPSPTATPPPPVEIRPGAGSR